MRDGGSIYAGAPVSAVLRWSEIPGGPAREENVAIVTAHRTEAVVACALPIPEETTVALIGNFHVDSGVVCSCEADGTRFLVTLRIAPHETTMTTAYDPGILAVDNFISPEAEDAILREIELESDQHC